MPGVATAREGRERTERREERIESERIESERLEVRGLAQRKSSEQKAKSQFRPNGVGRTRENAALGGFRALSLSGLSSARNELSREQVGEEMG